MSLSKPDLSFDVPTLAGLLENAAALDELFHGRLQELDIYPRAARRALLELHHSPFRRVLLLLRDQLGGVVRLVPARKEARRSTQARTDGRINEEREDTDGWTNASSRKRGRVGIRRQNMKQKNQRSTSKYYVLS